MSNFIIYNGIQTFNSRKEKNTVFLLTENELMAQMFAVYEKGKNIAVLDHADYKQAASHYLLGAEGVEETLCHHSNLYDILTKEMGDYFKYNRKHLNKGLYEDRGFYIKDVEFFYNNQKATFNVLGATAPNNAMQFKKFTQEENKKALYSRIDFILSVAALNDVDILVVGPFGCSVYGQKVESVITIFKELLTNKYANEFEKVYFNTNKHTFYLRALKTI